MSLLKMFMMSATAAATLFTGVSSDVPAADFPDGYYAMAPEEDKSIGTDAAIYAAVRDAVTESFDSGESVLARHFWSADVLTGNTGKTLSEHPVLMKKKGTAKKAAANTDSGADVLAADTVGNEAKPAAVGSSVDRGSNAGAGIAADNGTAKIVADAGKASKAAPAGSTDTAVSQSASQAVNGGNASGNTGSNETLPAPTVPETVPAGNATRNTGSSETLPAPTVPETAPTVPETAPTVPETAPAVPETVPAGNPADAGGSGESEPAPVVSADNGPRYDHTTSIYTNDESTLLRVEYYDSNNKLFEYSSVDNYDKATNSYTETVYKWDYENDTQVTVRTDTYVNGELTSSVTP